MTIGEAREAIDNFFQYSNNKPTGVVFYGGEPLLNRPVLLDSVNYIRKKEKKLKLRQQIDLTIITNGTNIDQKVAKELGDMGVYIIISLDGRKNEHDKLRIYKNGQGTFNDVLSGYHLYQSAGCRVGISCTIGCHNYDNLESIFNFFATKLKPVNVGINLPHDDHNNPLNLDLDLKDFYQNLFKIFEKFTDDNLYIEHIMKKLILLFKHEIKINDCPACGGRLVVLPYRKLGICEGAIGIDNYFFHDLKSVTKMSREWYFTSPLFNKKCSSCLALGVCGGGCPFDGYFQKKKIGYKDKRRCLFVKKIVEWGLYNFYLFNKDKLITKDFFHPNKKNQNIFLNQLGAKSSKLPLRSTVNFNNIKL